MRDAPTACRHTVSGTISLRSRGTFHHSLTVLSAIGHQGIFRLSGWSRQIHTGFLGPRATWVSLKRAVDVSATGVLPSTPDLSHVLRLHQRFLTRLTAGRPMKETIPQPRMRNPCRVSHAYGLASSGFARHYSRNHGCFLFLRVLRCFTSPRSLHTTLCVQVWVTAHDDCRVSPFGNPRIKAWLTAPRGLSWPPTSFIGSWCQGIHRAPLKTWPQMLASTVQFSNNDQPPITHDPTRRVSLGPALKATTIRPFPQRPNSVPDTPDPLTSRSTPEAVLAASRPCVPNSQRSTHEQPAPDIRRRTGL